MKPYWMIALVLLSLPVAAAELNTPDLPPHAQVDSALDHHLLVQSAQTAVKIEQLNQRKLALGQHEFNVRAGMAQRRIGVPNQALGEWDVALERGLRLPNKAALDEQIGAEGVNRAEQALGDAHHEAGRTLLHLWFNWQREQAQISQWQQQFANLQQQAAATDKRFKAGDAPKMELNQAQAAVSQAGVALQQAQLRSQLAATELRRQFPAIALPAQMLAPTPQPIEQSLAWWSDKIMQHNHELALVQAELRYQQHLAERSRAERMPDPTVGLRFSNEMGGNEKVTGVYVNIPLPGGVRSANAEQIALQVELATYRETALRQKLSGDIDAAYNQALANYQTWQQAQQTAERFRQHAELVTRAYTLGESSLSDTLSARRLALEAALSANLAQLDANESRYRLLLDAHQLWAQDDHDEHTNETH